MLDQTPSQDYHPPKVVIVGRTNVGKSTLFNRFIEEQKSLVSAIPGTTRDVHEADAIWCGRTIRLVDTGGLDINKADEIEQNIEIQAKKALETADLILFVVDLQAGPVPEDRQLAKMLVQKDTPILVIGNKADNTKIRQRVHSPDWVNWPFDKPLPVSAHRGMGSGDILDAIYEKLEEVGKPPVDIRDVASMRVSVIGRPNVGKSTLLNSMIGAHRFIAADKEHTTRAPNDTRITVDGRNYTLIDTAGIRKIARVNASDSKLEQTGVAQSRTIAKRSDVVLFVLDISKSIHRQDKFLAGELADAEASVVIVANKWDKIPDKETNTINTYEEYIRHHLPSLSYAPIVFISAETGQRVQGLFDLIDEVYAARFTQLSNAETKKFISQAIVRHKPSRGKGVAHPKITFFRQARVNPPVFHLGIRQQRQDALNPSYLRFLINRLRDEYDFEGTPIRISIKGRKKSHTT